MSDHKWVVNKEPCGSEPARDGAIKFNKKIWPYPALRNASINSCLRIDDRPGIFFALASFIKLSTVCVSREAWLLREWPSRLVTARRADSLRSSDLALAGFLRPEPPLRSPPPDCLFTVAQARASASSFETPLCS